MPCQKGTSLPSLQILPRIWIHHSRTTCQTVLLGQHANAKKPLPSHFTTARTSQSCRLSHALGEHRGRSRLVCHSRPAFEGAPVPPPSHQKQRQVQRIDTFHRPCLHRHQAGRNVQQDMDRHGRCARPPPAGHTVAGNGVRSCVASGAAWAGHPPAWWTREDTPPSFGWEG